jgi:uncharacterized protein YodC (DUF2158 family)
MSDGEKISRGDVVMLKSGGPRMTVQNLGDAKPGSSGAVRWVHCIWFEGNTICEYNFDLDVLKKVE